MKCNDIFFIIKLGNYLLFFFVFSKYGNYNNILRDSVDGNNKE